MNRQSIIFSITLGYIISIFLIFISFSFLISHEVFKKEEQLIDKYKPIFKIIMKQKHGFDPDFEDSFLELNYKIFTKEDDIKSIVNNKDKKPLFFKTHKKYKEFFEIFELEGKNYILISRKNKEILIKDEESNSSNSTIYLVFVLVLLLFATTFMYLKTRKKLFRLKLLKDKVINLADENFDFDFELIEQKDEVSLLANEFKNTALKLKNLKESRNIFIRNIMHELKTPITKGKFLTQLERSDENNEKLKSVFSKLEALINEFATIEELIANSKNIDKRNFFLEDLIDNAKDILMIEDESLICEYENIKLNVNFKLFSIALKNLIDNGIKYSNDKKIIIKNQNEDIIFENYGEKLKDDLQKYCEPFSFKSSNDSFGLGLYIVHNILKANNYTLKYEYKDNKNIFICKKDIKSTI